MFSCSLCIYLSLVLNGTPGVLKLVVVTHRVVLFSLPFSSACFSDERGRRSPSTIDDLLFCSCTLAPLHQRHYRSACFCLLSKPIAPQKPHLCTDVSRWRWSILTNWSFLPVSFGKPKERAVLIHRHETSEMFVFTFEIKCGKSTIILWYARATQEHMLLLFLSVSKGGS